MNPSTRRITWSIALTAALAAAGCGTAIGEGPDSPDGASSAPDAALSPALDAANVAVDASAPAADASLAEDAAVGDPDAAAGETDAGVEGRDAETGAPDAALPDGGPALPRADCETAPLRTTGTVYYYCDCQAGSTSCTPGDDASDGLTPATAKRSLTNAAGDGAFQIFRAMDAGDTVALCRGGAWALAGMNTLENTRCTAAEPCELRDYGSAALPRPILDGTGSTATKVCPFNSGAFSTGLRIWNLDIRLRLLNIEDVGLQLNSLLQDVDICNVNVDGGRTSINLGTATASIDTRVTIRHNQFRRAAFAAVAGGTPGLIVDSNYFEYCGLSDTGNGSMFDHFVYLYADASTAPVEWYQQYTNNLMVADSRTTGVILVVHGRGGHRMRIENNMIRVESGSAPGIQLASSFGSGSFFESLITRNRIHYAVHGAGSGIEMSCCQDCTLSDNIVLGGRISVANDAGGDCNSSPPFQSARAIVRNNSMYLTSAYSGWGGLSIGFGSGHLVQNNAIWTGSPTNCLKDGTGTAVMDHNFCSIDGQVPVETVWEDAPHGNFTPKSTGPLVGAANQADYSPVAVGSVEWSPTDLGVRRSTPVDIGAMIR